MPTDPRSGSEPSALPDASVCLLVVDSYAPSRIGLAALLEEQPWIGRSLLAGGGEEAVELARRHRPDVAIIDISEAGPFAGSTTAAIRAASPGVQMLLTSRCRTGPGAALGSLGAVDFLPAGVSGKEIARRVRIALLGEAADSAEAYAADLALTDREREVLLLLGTGATNREIGERLHLGPDSVKKCASALYRKLGVRNRTEAVRHAASTASI